MESDVILILAIVIMVSVLLKIHMLMFLEAAVDDCYDMHVSNIITKFIRFVSILIKIVSTNEIKTIHRNQISKKVIPSGDVHIVELRLYREVPDPAGLRNPFPCLMDPGMKLLCRGIWTVRCQ